MMSGLGLSQSKDERRGIKMRVIWEEFLYQKVDKVGTQKMGVNKGEKKGMIYWSWRKIQKLLQIKSSEWEGERLREHVEVFEPGV